MGSGNWQNSYELHEKETCHTRIGESSVPWGRYPGASQKQNVINEGAGAPLDSSSEGVLLEFPANNGEKHKESSEELIADSSGVPLMAVMCNSAMGECPRLNSEVTYSDSSLIQGDATRNDISMVEDCTIHFHEDQLSSEDSDYCSVSCREQEATDEVIDKESQRDTGESTPDMGAKNGFRCDGKGLMRGLFRKSDTGNAFLFLLLRLHAGLVHFAPRTCESRFITPQRHQNRVPESWVSTARSAAAVGPPRAGSPLAQATGLAAVSFAVASRRRSVRAPATGGLLIGRRATVSRSPRTSTTDAGTARHRARARSLWPGLRSHPAPRPRRFYAGSNPGTRDVTRAARPFAAERQVERAAQGSREGSPKERDFCSTRAVLLICVQTAVCGGLDRS
ncbi:hypothetical protein HPB50_016038 [Hyalomma asiaticum]|uniref:Uncharacterized protein n=1 Tax=Hyalomma asiaticum TaxID=266040 RepID=A0ACB7TE60_HYAAI|nr:hypothetical protein HPB50_016038 [Hyalomma asiaticum]